MLKLLNITLFSNCIKQICTSNNILQFYINENLLMYSRKIDIKKILCNHFLIFEKSKSLSRHVNKSDIFY